jgi:hypothetical protein
MPPALIVTASVIFYLSCWVTAARWKYRRIRPWTEPLNCTSPAFHEHAGHLVSCYSRYGDGTTESYAIGCASVFGLLGPLAFAAMLAGQLIRTAVTSGTSKTREELEAKVKRLENELGVKD